MTLKLFEISKRKNKDGRRKIKLVLHEIYPDSCIDEGEQVGTQYNINGITWIREYCEKAMPTIADMSIRAEFLDEERTELNGHGETGISEDGIPMFEDAQIIGHCTKGYVDTIADEDGTEHTVMMAEGYLDEMCYKAFVDKLEEDMANNNAPFGSVEIYRSENNDSIEYKYGYKAKGRIPSEFIYSGYALLGVKPADNQARLIELNNENKEDEPAMNENEIRALVENTVNEMTRHMNEINECRADCEVKIAEANAAKDAAISEKNEIEASSQEIQAALDKLQAEYDELSKKYEALWEERKALEKALGEAKAKERIGEMNAAIANFSDEEKAYADAEIKAFEAEPVTSEINSIVAKIYEGIGKKAKADAEAAAVVAEQNAAEQEVDVEDIFSEVNSASDEDDESIF